PAIDPFGSLSHRFLPLFVFVVVQPPDRLGRHRTGHLFGQPWESVDPLSHPVSSIFFFAGLSPVISITSFLMAFTCPSFIFPALSSVCLAGFLVFLVVCFRWGWGRC